MYKVILNWKSQVLVFRCSDQQTDKWMTELKSKNGTVISDFGLSQPSHECTYHTSLLEDGSSTLWQLSGPHQAPRGVTKPKNSTPRYHRGGL